MPRQLKKRGRRGEEKKRKLEAADYGEDQDHDHDHHSHKRHRSNALHTTEEFEEYDASAPNRPPEPPQHTPFFGLLDEEEQEYFKRADDLLELNQFQSPEERRLFLANVYKEADGKELRLASSQSCSRLLERLILLSRPDQLKNLFQQFSGNFIHLVQHRFASHCCEALFIHAAPIVSQELSNGGPAIDNGDPNAIVESMENLFLHTILELDENVGYLMTDKFASHALRILLVILSGQPLERRTRNNLLQSKRKEHTSVNGLGKHDELTLESRVVLKSFDAALEKLIHECVSGLDTSYVRALATHKLGNPVLQLLLQIELTHFGKHHAKDESSLMRKLLPDDPITAESESAVFINGLLYDVIGSRLLEAIIQYAPGKTFKTLYRQFFKDRIPSLARNEIAGYVASKVLERLGKDELAEQVEATLPQIPTLVERNRTAIIRTLVDACAKRNVDTTSLAAALESAYASAFGFDITRLLKLADSRHASNTSSPADPDHAASANSKAALQKPPKSHRTPASQEKLHASLLAQSMLAVPGPLSTLVFESLMRLPPALALKCAYDTSASRVIQAALTSPLATVIFRRKLIQTFYGEIGAMALDPGASQVVDSVWDGTGGLAFVRERVAEELAENEASLRESGCGRWVWRKWEMDMWRRRRGDWVKRCREDVGSEGFLGWPEGEGDGEGGGRVVGAMSAVGGGGAESRDGGKGRETKRKGKEALGGGRTKKKTGIEMARERHAAKKMKDGRVSSVNGRAGGRGPG